MNDFIIDKAPEKYCPKIFSNDGMVNMIDKINKPHDPMIIPTQIKS